jgi:hypothetical protein
MAEGTRQQWAASGSLPEGIIFPELVHSGITETLVQNSAVFNAASLNAIRMVPVRRLGDFHHSSFFKNVSSIINRRGVAGSPENPDVASNPVPIDERISVKLNRRIGPIDQTLDSFKKIGMSADLEVLSFAIGEQIAKAIEIEKADRGLSVVSAAIQNVAALNIDRGPANSPQGTLTTDDLVDALALFGDAASRIVIWVMHSKPFYDLVKDQIGLNIDGISNFNVASATPVTLNRPVLVTDSAALISQEASPEVNQYTTLGLTTDAVILEDSEEPTNFSEIISGKDNLVVRLQGEFAYNLGLRGFTFDKANGGVNPDDATLSTGSNWDTVMDSNKDLSGVALTTL